MVTMFTRQQNIVFKVKIVDRMKIKDGGSQKNATQADPHGKNQEDHCKVCNITLDITKK